MKLHRYLLILFTLMLSTGTPLAYAMENGEPDPNWSPKIIKESAGWLGAKNVFVADLIRYGDLHKVRISGLKKMVGQEYQGTSYYDDENKAYRDRVQELISQYEKFARLKNQKFILGFDFSSMDLWDYNQAHQFMQAVIDEGYIRESNGQYEIAAQQFDVRKELVNVLAVYTPLKKAEDNRNKQGQQDSQVQNNAQSTSADTSDTGTSKKISGVQKGTMLGVAGSVTLVVLAVVQVARWLSTNEVAKHQLMIDNIKRLTVEAAEPMVQFKRETGYNRLLSQKTVFKMQQLVEEKNSVALAEFIKSTVQPELEEVVHEQSKRSTMSGYLHQLKYGVWCDIVALKNWWQQSASDETALEEYAKKTGKKLPSRVAKRREAEKK